MLERAAQRACGCPIAGGVQGQVGWGPGQPGLLLNAEVGAPLEMNRLKGKQQFVHQDRFTKKTHLLKVTTDDFF